MSTIARRDARAKLFGVGAIMKGVPPREGRLTNMLTGKKVMVVDDDPVSLEIARAVLEDLGCVVTTRERALGTSVAITVNRPDIVLVDISMPGVTGDAIVRLARSNPLLKDVIFVLYSGKPAEELDKLAEEVGAAGAVTKSGDVKDFARQFRRIVDKPRPARKQ